MLRNIFIFADHRAFDSDIATVKGQILGDDHLSNIGSITRNVVAEHMVGCPWLPLVMVLVTLYLPYGYKSDSKLPYN